MGRRRRRQPANSGLLGILILLLLVVAFLQRFWPWIVGGGIVLVVLHGISRAAGTRKRRERALGLTLEQIDALNGLDFEGWITDFLDAHGFRCTNIRHSGDFGIDVIAERNGLRIGIQAKNYQGHVGNDAVQQALAGCDYHGCPIASVVTQSTFTHAAREQAAHAHLPVILIDRERLAEMAGIFREVTGGEKS